MKDLELVFYDMSLVVDEIIKNFGEPVKPSKEEIEKLKYDITNNPANNNPRMQKNFVLIERVAGEILFSHNVDKYLALSGDFDLMTFLSSITGGSDNWNYLYDYLAWAKATYSFAAKNKNRIDWQNAYFKASMPMLLADGNIYWISHEIHPLEIDKNNSIISHINTYTILNRYTEKQQVALMAELYVDDSYNAEFTKELTETRYLIQEFSVGSVQRKILKYFLKNPNATLAQCYESIKVDKSIHTFKKYISESQHHQGIIDKAKISFPEIPFKSTKDVALFLDKIGWFK